jgi:hypothetical protein
MKKIKILMLLFSVDTMGYETSIIALLSSALWYFTLTVRLRYENASSEANLEDRYAKKCSSASDFKDRELQKIGKSFIGWLCFIGWL